MTNAAIFHASCARAFRRIVRAVREAFSVRPGFHCAVEERSYRFDGRERPLRGDGTFPAVLRGRRFARKRGRFRRVTKESVTPDMTVRKS